MKIPRFTGPPLAYYNSDFHPPRKWGKRTGKIALALRNTLLFFIPKRKEHILCGSPGVGKSTLMYEGLHELADVGVYSKGDLAQLREPEPNVKNRQFIIERSGLRLGVDSWIDIVGEEFDKAFAPGAQGNKATPVLDDIFLQVNSLAMVFAADPLLNLYRRRENLLQRDHQLIDGFCNRVNGLHPTLKEKARRKGFRWHLVINQCGDVLGTNNSRLLELTEAIRYFAEKTAFGRLCQSAILCESKPELAKLRKVEVESISVGKHHKLEVSDPQTHSVCSAGVALAIILGYLRPKTNDYNFLIPLNKLKQINDEPGA